MSVLRFDSEMLVTPHLAKLVGHDSPMMHLRRYQDDGLCDRRSALGLTVAEPAERAGMSEDEIECIEEGGTAPTIASLRHLAEALNADVRLTSGHGLGSVWFEPHAA